MTSDMQPRIDIVLVASPFCFLNRKEEFFIYLKYKLHYHEPITIKPLGSIFNPAATFARNRIEVRDTVTDEAVTFKSNSGKSSSSTSSSSENQDNSFVLQPEEESYLFWTTSSLPQRWHEYSFDTSPITPNRKYTITYLTHGITHWHSGSHSSLTSLQSTTIAHQQPGTLLQVRLLNSQPAHFQTRPSLRPSPPLKLTLSTSSQTCSLSGSPPFTITLTWKLDPSTSASKSTSNPTEKPRGIYALLTLEPNRAHGLQFHDPSLKNKNGNGKGRTRIGPPPNTLEGDSDHDTESSEIFVSLKDAHDSFTQSYTLATNPRRNGLIPPDTRGMEPGGRYEVTLRNRKWRWCWQDEVDEEKRGDEGKVRDLLNGEPVSIWQGNNNNNNNNNDDDDDGGKIAFSVE